MNREQTTLNEISRLRSRVDDLSSLIEVSIIINSTLDLEELIGLVMEKAQSVMRAEASSVMLINEKTNRLECEVALGQVGETVRKTIQLARGQGVAGWTWQHQKPLIVPDVEKDPRFYSAIDQKSGFRTKSILAVPLLAKERIIGVAEVINRTDGKQFTEDDLDLFSTFGRQVSLAIENARMHKMELEQERLRQQLESAKVIQQSFMPEILPRAKEDKFQLAAKNLPAISVGGDFYDAVELDENHLGLLIGDVSGKGVPAALYMARLMSDFRFFVQQEKQPADLLFRLNEILVDRSRQGMFVTLQYLIIDILTGHVRFCDAGHLPIIHVSGKSKQAGLVPCDKGVPLGIVKSMQFAETELVLEPGDSLMLYTDGIIETMNEKNEQFSIHRLVDFVSRKKATPEKLIDRLIKEVKKFSENMPQHDDITAMALRWNGLSV